MGMTDSVVLLWRIPSLFRWAMVHFWNIFISRS